MLCFFQKVEVCCEQLFVGKGDAIDAGELLIFYVPTPVGCCYVVKVYGLYISCVWKVWADTPSPEIHVGKLRLACRLE